MSNKMLLLLMFQ